MVNKNAKGMTLELRQQQIELNSINQLNYLIDWNKKLC